MSLTKMNKEEFEKAKKESIEKWNDILKEIEETGIDHVEFFSYCGFCNHFRFSEVGGLCYILGCTYNCPCKPEICGHRLSLLAFLSQIEDKIDSKEFGSRERCTDKIVRVVRRILESLKNLEFEI